MDFTFNLSTAIALAALLGTGLSGAKAFFSTVSKTELKETLAERKAEQDAALTAALNAIRETLKIYTTKEDARVIAKEVAADHGAPLLAKFDALTQHLDTRFAELQRQIAELKRE